LFTYYLQDNIMQHNIIINWNNNLINFKLINLIITLLATVLKHCKKKTHWNILPYSGFNKSGISRLSNISVFFASNGCSLYNWKMYLKFTKKY